MLSFSGTPYYTVQHIMARKNTTGISATVYFDNFSTHTYERVQALAKRERRSISQTIVLLLEAYFMEQDNRTNQQTAQTKE